MVAVAVDLAGKKLGRARIPVIKDASKEPLHGFIKGDIAAGSQLITDDWPGYSGIENEGFCRETYNQSEAGGDDDLLPHVHLIVSLLKRWL